jgi:hypothetical protein
VKYFTLLLLVVVFAIPTHSTSNLIQDSSLATDRNSKLDQKIKSLENITNELSDRLSKNEIAQSFFSSDINQLTAIFLGITTFTIAIVGYIIGYLIPKRNEKRFEEKFEEFDGHFENMQNSINEKLEELEQRHLEHDLNFASAMYILNDQNDNSAAAALWPIKYLSVYYKLNNNTQREGALIKEKINNASAHIDKISEFGTVEKELAISTIKSRIDSVNMALQVIKESESNEEIISMISNLREEIYKLLYAKRDDIDEMDDLPF